MWLTNSYGSTRSTITIPYFKLKKYVRENNACFSRIYKMFRGYISFHWKKFFFSFTQQRKGKFIKVQSTDTTLKRLSSKTIFTCNSMLISKHYKLTGKLEREN